MNEESISKLSAAIRDVPDFPKAGILFKDITPILGDPGLLRLSIDLLIESAGGQKIDKVIGIDARGFIFGAAMADRIGAGFVPVRKKGKLPYETIGESYDLEYGSAEIELHKDACGPGENVFMVDDLLATGGTAAAAIKLVKSTGANLFGVAFLIELGFLDGRKALGDDVPVHAILKY